MSQNSGSEGFFKPQRPEVRAGVQDLMDMASSSSVTKIGEIAW